MNLIPYYKVKDKNRANFIILIRIELMMIAPIILI
jgi:hypothetical protein